MKARVLFNDLETFDDIYTLAKFNLDRSISNGDPIENVFVIDNKSMSELENKQEPKLVRSYWDTGGHFVKEILYKDIIFRTFIYPGDLDKLEIRGKIH